MYEAQLRIKMNGTDRHPVNLDLAELLAGVCSDIVMDGGTLSLESVENVAYPIPVVNFGNDCTHTYVTGRPVRQPSPRRRRKCTGRGRWAVSMPGSA